MVETTDEVNLVKEIERLESMYLHYKFLCCFYVVFMLFFRNKKIKRTEKKYLKIYLRKQKGLKNILML